MSVDNFTLQKNEYRKKHREIRSNMSAQTKAQLDNKLKERLINDSVFKAADIIFAFVSKDIEVNTHEIIKHCFAHSKRVAVPLCNASENSMDFYCITSFDDLVQGCYGISQPNPKKCKKVCDFSSAICLVPGLAYDRNGFRVGFGKGYYDRFLTDFPGTTVGLCYSCCIEDELPRSLYDRSVDLVVTEKYTLKICDV